MALVQGPSFLPARALQTDFEVTIQSMLVNDVLLAELRQQREGDAVDACDIATIQCMTADELVAPAKKSYGDFLKSALAVIGSDRPYSDIYVELQNLTSNLEAQTAQGDYGAHLLAVSLADQVITLYAISVEHAAHVNAIRAATEIYLSIAADGVLPASPVPFLPEDPFSGESFEYQRSDDGFILRCRTEDLSSCHLVRPGEDGSTCVTHEYKFRVAD